MTDSATTEQRSFLAGANERRILQAFFAIYKVARMVESSNDTFRRQFGNFIDVWQPMAKEHGEVTIKYHAGRYFVNGSLVPFEGDLKSGAFQIVKDWEKVGMGGIVLPETASEDDLLKVFTFLAEIRPDETNIDILSKELDSLDLGGVRLFSTVSVAQLNSEISEEMRRQFRIVARSTFTKAMAVVQEAMVRTDEGKEVNTSKTKRVVHTLIDQITRDEQSLIELTAIRDYDDYTYAHSTNVAVYSLTLGVRIGLDRGRLSQLGFAALFHDIGKVKLPVDLIRKPDAFDENDWLQMQRHPALGAKTILRNMKLEPHTARAARGAFEHHINEDFTGYPTLHYERRNTELFSKIISIADSFDALTSGRVYIKKSMTPDVVFKKLRFQMGVKFDKFLLQLFNDIIGIYPAGSMVLLSTNEIALILTNNETHKDRPYLKIIGNESGMFDEPIWLDLSLPENHDRKIVRQIDPERYGLNVRDFVLSD